MTARSSSATPRGWNSEAHGKWLRGKRQEAVQAAARHLQSLGDKPTVALVLQLAYYLFLLNDFPRAARVLEEQMARTPDHAETVLNLSVCYSRLGRHAEAAVRANDVLKLEPGNMVALDVLAKTLHRLGRHTEASAAGTHTLEIKDRAALPAAPGWRLPADNPHEFARRDGKPDVIAFSLWGKDPRYLRGALQNLLLARQHFPGWNLRFHMDDSVPAEFIELIGGNGGQVIMHPVDESLRLKLCRRFLVANDPDVGHFLVRDVDSVFSAREAEAVAAWLASDRWFHVIRDWWTHTDLVLAGTWGGVAGVLPSLSRMLEKYVPKTAETPNVDQWFLRDRIWSYLRQSCLVHDRCFRMSGSILPPGEEPAGTQHIGQDEYAVRRAEQEQFLREWIERYACLRDGVAP